MVDSTGDQDLVHSFQLMTAVITTTSRVYNSRLVSSARFSVSVVYSALSMSLFWKLDFCCMVSDMAILSNRR